MSAVVIADRVQFAALIMFHYLFPPVTIGLGVLIAVLKTLQLARKDERYAHAARFWARLYVLNFGAGVVTGIPMEFQFGTNWAQFSNIAGGVVGQTLMMEGAYAFFIESLSLGIFLFGERRVPPIVHWFSSVLLAVGSILSAYFITAADAWMQHPVAYSIAKDGRLRLDSLGKMLANPYETWEFLHTFNGALVHGAMLMAALGAYYMLAGKHVGFARICLKLGLVTGLIFTLTQVFPTGAKNGEAVTKYNPVKLAAMEGQFKTEQGAPLAIIGMPDTSRGVLLDPIYVPELLSYLAYGDFHASVKGLNDYPADLRPPVEVTYYAYHIMITLGGVFIGLMALGVFLLWRKTLFQSRWFLWMLMLSVPFPYIANEAGWVVTCVGRQPWLIYGILRTTQGISPNVSSGEVIFTLIGFAGTYLLLGLLFVFMVLRFIGQGPEEPVHTDPADERAGGNLEETA